MDWKDVIAEGMYLLCTLMVGFLVATLFLLSGVITWSADDLLWFLPLCVGMSYGGRIAAREAKARTDCTLLSDAVKTLMKNAMHNNQPG